MVARSSLSGLLALLLAGAALTPARGVAGDAELAPGDTLSLKIIEWRADLGQPFEWPGLSGEYVIDGSGALALPIVGFVPAQQRTVADVAGEIGKRLQKATGLARPLQVSVQIAKYRPCYVSGDVEKPGEYAFRPNLTVLEAVSVAGGLFRQPDTQAQLERQLTEEKGRASNLRVEALSLAAESARLQAETTDASAIAFPADVKSDAAGAKAMQVQQALFDTRKAALKTRLQALDEAKRLYLAETDTLTQKLKVLAHQAELNKAELGNVDDLMKKGLTTTVRKLALEQDQNQIESTELEYRLSIIRAQQGIAGAERDKNDAVNARKSAALADLATAEAKLNQNAGSRTTSERLMAAIAEQLRRAGGRAASPATAPVYTVHRPGVDQPIKVGENDVLQPGDDLKVATARPEDASD